MAAQEDQETNAEMWRRIMPLALRPETWGESDLREFVVMVLAAAGGDAAAWWMTSVTGATFDELLLLALRGEASPPPAPAADNREERFNQACAHAWRELDTLNREIGGDAMRVATLSDQALRDGVRAFAHRRRPGRPTTGEHSARTRLTEEPLPQGEATLAVWRQLGLAPRARQLRKDATSDDLKRAQNDEAAAIIAADRFLYRVFPGRTAARAAVNRYAAGRVLRLK